MTNPYYNGGSFPATGAPATSASMRAELSAITAGFDKLPVLSGNANKLVVVNSSASALEVTTALPPITIADTSLIVEDNGDNTRRFRFEANVITPGATRVLTVPDANLTLVGEATAQTLTNKTLNLASNTLVATSAQIAAAVTDETGSGALVFGTNPTISGATLTGGSLNNTPIGGSTPNTGAFTTLSSTGNTTLGDAVGDLVTVNGTTTFANANPTLSAGTANGVLYLNGSKVATSGSALTYNGTGLGVGVASAAFALDVGGSDGTNIALRSTGTTAARFRAYVNGAESGVIGFLNGGGQLFEVAGSEQMRLTSTGLGIGTSSPGAKLGVGGNAIFSGGVGGSPFIAFSQDQAGGTPAYWQWSSSTGLSTFYTTNASSSNGSFKWMTGGSDKMFLDSSGNLGLGVTPSAWGSSYKALQLPAGAISADSTAVIEMRQNSRWTGSANVYVNNGFASNYYQYNGTHAFFTAPSGTAGNAISFTQAMTLDASGNLGVGITSPAQRLDVRGTTSATIRVGSTGNGGSGDEFGNLEFYWADPDAAEVKAKIYAKNVGNVGPGGGGAADLLFATRPAFGSLDERARITSGGDLLVGVTTAAAEGGFTLYPQGSSGAPLAVWNRASTTNTTTAADFRNGSTSVGSITYTNTATAYVTSSDYRLKDSPQPLTNSGAFIDALQPKTWDWKTDGSKGVGFIAHEVQAVSPSSVVGEKDAVDAEGKPVMQAMEYGSAEFIANIIAELQSLRARVAALEGV